MLTDRLLTRSFKLKGSAVTNLQQIWTSTVQKSTFPWKRWAAVVFPGTKWHLSGSLLTSGSPMWSPGNHWGGSRGLSAAEAALLRRRLVAEREAWTFPVNCQQLIGLGRISTPVCRHSAHPLERNSWTAVIGQDAGGSAVWLDVLRLKARRAEINTYYAKY